MILEQGGNMDNWSGIEIEPADKSACEACGLPAHALRKVPDWPKPGSYPFLGAVSECDGCRDKLPLYAPDEFTGQSLCGLCYGQVRSLGLSDELHITPA